MATRTQIQARRRATIEERAGGLYKLPPDDVERGPVECGCALCGVPAPPDDQPHAWDWCGDCVPNGSGRHH